MRPLQVCPQRRIEFGDHEVEDRVRLLSSGIDLAIDLLAPNPTGHCIEVINQKNLAVVS